MSDRNRLGEIRAKLSARTGALEILRVGPTVGHERFDEWQDKPHRLLYDAIDIGRATISDLSYLLSELATLRKDAAIGAKVRAWVSGDSADQLDEFADVLSKPMFLGSETSPAVELVRTIASALREEG